MLLKFTNASENFRGNIIYIAKEWIVSTYEVPRDNGSLVTLIYGGPTGIVWEVEESLGEVRKIVNGV